MNFHEKILNQNKTFDEIANPSESHKGIINLIVKEKQNKKIEHKNKDNEAISTQKSEDTEIASNERKYSRRRNII